MVFGPASFFRVWSRGAAYSDSQWIHSYADLAAPSSPPPHLQGGPPDSRHHFPPPSWLGRGLPPPPLWLREFSIPPPPLGQGSSPPTSLRTHTVTGRLSEARSPLDCFRLTSPAPPLYTGSLTGLGEASPLGGVFGGALFIRGGVGSPPSLAFLTDARAQRDQVDRYGFQDTVSVQLQDLVFRV